MIDCQAKSMDASSGASRSLFCLGISVMAQLIAATSVASLAVAAPAAFGFDVSGAPSYFLGVFVLVPAVIFAPIVSLIADNQSRRMVLASAAFATWLVSTLTFALTLRALM